ncbi:MAG: (2Fe-2S) ferredoxin domain-containing protein, partial [Desulfobulbaceae bacterium]|nr:(2Fe-2S) ferredoxin domain-containing protein [Desulfobulbaceae bacterium]HIJ79786.1 (2Fe-2S) ferredoxin domain-containing protein [Deltaproteobacteria bacterium]
GFLQYIEEEVLDRDLDCLITATTCLKQCDLGPIMVIQPENWWFKGVDSEEAIDAILDGLAEGEPAADYLITNKE